MMSLLAARIGLLSVRRRFALASAYEGTLAAVALTTADARARAATHEAIPACGGGTLRPSASQRALATALREGRL